MLSVEILEIAEWFVESAIKREQAMDEQDRVVDHDRRLAIAGVVAQMRQADAAERTVEILFQMEDGIRDIDATLAAIQVQLESLTDIQERRAVHYGYDSQYNDPEIIPPGSELGM